MTNESKQAHHISASCEGETCSMCSKLATHKVGEEIAWDDPMKMRHNFTAYVCCEHFRAILGPAVPCAPTSAAQEREAELPPLPDASLWMTNESKRRLSDGGKGSVPVHGKRSSTAKIPLFTADQMRDYARAALAAPKQPMSALTDEQLCEIAMWLEEAAADVMDWGGYASGYMQDKHGLEDDIDKYTERAAKVRAVLAAAQGEKNNG